jgi:hypothetical protein
LNWEVLIRNFAFMMKWILNLVFLVPFITYAQDQNKVQDTAKEKWDTTVIKQFDGSKLHIVCNNNMYINYCETSDGYTIVLDGIGMYEYAKKGRKGDMVPNGSPAKDEDQRNDKEKRALRGVKKHLRYTGETLELLQEKEKRVKDDPAIIKRYKKKKPNQ